MRNTFVAIGLLAAGAVPLLSERAASRAQSEIQQTNDRFVQQVMTTIKGHEQEPAGTVFKNVKYLQNTPAERFLRIMNGGYAKALGVTCTHCHEEGDFASDAKRPKRAAREMQVMHRSINTQLQEMKELKDDPDRRAISCISCHRGTLDPRNPS